MNKRMIASVAAGVVGVAVLALAVASAVWPKSARKPKTPPVTTAKTTQATTEVTVGNTLLSGEAIMEQEIRRVHTALQEEYESAFAGKSLSATVTGFRFADVRSGLSVPLDRVYTFVLADKKIVGITYMFRENGEIKSEFTPKATGWNEALDSGAELVLYENEKGRFAASSEKTFRLFETGPAEPVSDLKKITTEYTRISKAAVTAAARPILEMKDAGRVQAEATLISGKSGFHVDTDAVAGLYLSSPGIGYIELNKAFKEDTLSVVSGMTLKETDKPAEEKSLGTILKISYANDRAVRLFFRKDGIIEVGEDGEKRYFKDTSGQYEAVYKYFDDLFLKVANKDNMYWALQQTTKTAAPTTVKK